MTTSDWGNSHASFTHTLDQLNIPQPCLLHFSVKNQTPVHTVTFHPWTALDTYQGFWGTLLIRLKMREKEAGRAHNVAFFQDILYLILLPLPALSFRTLIWKRFRNFPWHVTNLTEWSYNLVFHRSFVILESELQLTFINPLTGFSTIKENKDSWKS